MEFLILDEYHHHREMVHAMTDQDLDQLATAILIRRLEIMAAKLEAAGFKTRIRPKQQQDPDQACSPVFHLILIFAPGGPTADLPNGWATLSDARRLLDIAHNLPIAEAFARWSSKREPIAREPYTRADAIRDMRRERADLRRQYQAGDLDHESFRLAWAHTRDYLKFVED